MSIRIATILIAFLWVAPLLAGDDGRDLAKVKEQELAEVRERISDLKKSMDAAAEERDRVTRDLQEVEITIAAQRRRLKEIEREQSYTMDRKRRLDAQLAEREAHLDAESGALASQVRAAYMSGSQEKIRLLLNQRDPATLGRLMAYYRYLNDYRADNIEAVVTEIRRLDELRAQIAAEEARLARLVDERYAELGRLNGLQEDRRALLAALKRRLADESREVERLSLIHI